MPEKQTHEQQRLFLQAELDAQKTQSERNRLGQFATPTDLAVDILTCAVNLLPSKTPIRFFDPAIGTGSFYSALRASNPTGQIDAAMGFEIDPLHALPSHKLWARTQLEIRHGDFTIAAAPIDDTDRFNLLICNPPYVRHHHIVNGEKARLQDASESACGVRITGLSGLYCYFLAISHAWMTQDGIAGWLIPSEFMDVNYGRAVKRYLLDKVSLVRIHRFDPNDVQFGDALVSSAIVFFRNHPPSRDHDVEFTFGDTLTKLKMRRMVTSKSLRKEKKWTRFPVSDVRADYTGLTLGDLFKIQRGLATGDNSFFILTRNEIEQRGLPWECFQPILPSPRYLTCDEVNADAAGNPLLERQLFLLNCQLPEEEVESRFPELWAYFHTGKLTVRDRYLCRHRNPWYRQEDRPPSPSVCTYFGRSNSKGVRPFRFILNHSSATVANVYLLLYPKPILRGVLEKDPSLTRKVWEFFNAIKPESLLDEGRVYGGGLHKLEPEELASVPIDGIRDLLPVNVQKPAIQLTLFDEEETST